MAVDIKGRRYRLDYPGRRPENSHSRFFDVMSFPGWSAHVFPLSLLHARCTVSV